MRFRGRKTLVNIFCCGAALCAAMLSSAQQTRAFQDVPFTDSSYAALSDLKNQGAIPGYPALYFHPTHPRTRYELAVALKRALDHYSAVGVCPGEVQEELRKLCTEFSAELQMLGETEAQWKAGLTRLSEPLMHGAAPPHTSSSLSPNIQVSLPDGLTPDLSLSTFSSSLSGRSAFQAGLLSGTTNTIKMFQSEENSPAPNALGMHFSLPLSGLAQVGVSVQQYTSNTLLQPDAAGALSYGAGITIRPIPHLFMGAAATHSLLQPSDSASATLLSGNSYRFNFGYQNGPARALLGYKVISPDTASLNSGLSALEGPYTTLSLDLGSSFHSYLSGEYLSPYGSAMSSSLLNANVYRGRAGLSWDATPGLSLSADYEGVYYDYAGALAGTHGPIEQYLTLGAGLNLSRGAILKLAYQIGNQAASGMNSPGTVTSVFSTQLSLHF